jgi:hypothetical protein
MRKTTPNLSQNDLGILLMIGATIFGGWIRLIPPTLSGFPINDGGLFYMMMTAIKENGYQLPRFVQYNGLSIPFTYPPLAFYVGTLTGNMLKISDIEILRWLPAIVIITTIPAFFFLAKTVLKSPISAGLATIFFALLPQSVTWYIMGGGLTRSLGFLFLILSTREIYLLFTERTNKHIWLSSIYSSLVVLIHPEATLHAIGIGIFFWFMLSRNRRGFKDSLLVGLLVAVFTSIWWISILLFHGIDPLISASKTGLYSVYSFAHPLLFTITGEPLATVIGVFGLIGIGFQLAKRDYFLPAWLIMHFVIEKRNAANVAVIPISLLAAITIHEIILPALQRYNRNIDKVESSHLFSSGVAKGFIVFIWLYLLTGMGYADMQLVGRTVSAGDRDAFQWIAENTPEKSSFLVLTGTIELFEDGVNEWFPALSGRSSITTIQGTEWVGTINFSQRVLTSQGLEQCVYEYLPLACIVSTADATGVQFDYIYISRNPFITKYSDDSKQNPRGDKLIAELNTASTDYQLIYQTKDVTIYKVTE